ncbi:MAG: HRDC domain-containing protein [Bryobacterales bacterium]|nr:HRDC domain-containing protein [Bryobacterales bacterium]
MRTLEWRREEARKRGLPAFRILTDRSLDALLDSRPASAQELLAVPGVGLAFVEKYGAAVFRLLHGG